MSATRGESPGDKNTRFRARRVNFLTLRNPKRFQIRKTPARAVPKEPSRPPFLNRNHRANKASKYRRQPARISTAPGDTRQSVLRRLFPFGYKDHKEYRYANQKFSFRHPEIARRD